VDLRVRVDVESKEEERVQYVKEGDEMTRKQHWYTVSEN